MMEVVESDLSFAAASGVRLGTACGGLEIFGDAWRDLEHWQLPEPDAAAGDLRQNPDVFRVRLAKPRDVVEDAGSLVQRRYQARGYEVRRTVADPALYTFAAYDKGQLVGTLGVRLDSANGLKVDELYGEEVAALRSRDLRLMELTRLAVAESAPSKEVLGALFHTALLFGHLVRKCSHAVIEVNPRHVAFYRRVLFFKPIGPERHLDRVGAPAVALTLELARLKGVIDEFFAAPDWREHTNSFFAHWFSPNDAEGVLGRLHRLEEERVASNARVAPSCGPRHLTGAPLPAGDRRCVGAAALA
jgi:hypothetical protein